MDIIKLKTRLREGRGKSYTRKARAQGWIPAIYYGHNLDAISIEVDHKEFAAIIRNRKSAHVMDLGIGKNQEKSMAVIREIQRNVIKDELFYHIDFMHVNMDEKVVVEIPVEITGNSIGVKMGGVLGNPIKTVMVECLPLDIPERITIDVTDLDIGQSIHAKDVNIANLTLKELPDEVIAIVTHPTRDNAEEGTAAADAGAAATEQPAAKPAAK